MSRTTLCSGSVGFDHSSSLSCCMNNFQPVYIQPFKLCVCFKIRKDKKDFFSGFLRIGSCVETTNIRSVSALSLVPSERNCRLLQLNIFEILLCILQEHSLYCLTHFPGCLW